MLVSRMLPFALALLSNQLVQNGAYADENANSNTNTCSEEDSSGTCNTSNNHAVLETDVLTSQLIDWLKDNGAYINEKLVVRNVDPNDPSSPRGVFTTEDMEVGETVCKIPWNLILKPKGLKKQKRTKAEMKDCGTIDVVKDAISGDNITPYGQYLLAQPKGYTVPFWSEDGRDYFAGIIDNPDKKEHLTEYDELPPHGLEWFIEEELKKFCNGDIDDPVYLHAAMLVKARSDYEFMVPFYDMMNHDNGKYNVKHVYDPYKPDLVDDEGYEIVTSKAIPSGGELYNSYNQCNICSDMYDWFGTPEMFFNYGFVERMPQRWLFDFARVKFDLDWKDGDESTGELVVKFLVPPSEKGIDLLQVELTRLEKYEKEYRHLGYEEKEVPQNEWDSLWQYYDALHDAILYAVQSNDARADEVWAMGDDWWVKDGTLKASDIEEHLVNPLVIK